MSDLTFRTIDIADAEAVLVLTQAADIADTGEIDFELADITSELRPATTSGWALADPDGVLVAATWLNQAADLSSQTGEFIVHPSAPVELAEPVLDAMLAAGREDPAGRKLHVMIAAGAAAKSTFLLDRGAIVVRHFFRMSTALTEPVPEPVWPAGAVLHTVTDTADDLRPLHLAVSEAFEDHWEHRSSTFESWLERHRARDDFDPSLWWLVRVDGEPAAAIVCDQREAGGFVGAIGVRRPYRGIGLARQLLMTAFAEFQRRGLTDASLFVDSTNPTGAVRLYESVGMHSAAQWDCHEFPFAG